MSCLELPITPQCGLFGTCMNATDQVGESQSTNALTASCVCSEGWRQSSELILYLNPKFAGVTKQILFLHEPFNTIEKEMAVDYGSLVNQTPCSANNVVERALYAMSILANLGCIILLFRMQSLRHFVHLTSLNTGHFLIVVSSVMKIVNPEVNIGQNIPITVVVVVGKMVLFLSLALSFIRYVNYQLTKLGGIPLFTPATKVKVKRGKWLLLSSAILFSVINILSYISASIVFSTSIDNDTNVLDLQFGIYCTLLYVANVMELLLVVFFAILISYLINVLLSDTKHIDLVLHEARTNCLNESNPYSFNHKLDRIRYDKYQEHCARHMPGLKRVRMLLLSCSIPLSIFLFLALCVSSFQHFSKYLQALMLIAWCVQCALMILTIAFSTQGRNLTLRILLLSMWNAEQKRRERSILEVTYSGRHLTSIASCDTIGAQLSNKKESPRRRKLHKAKKKVSDMSLKNSFTEGLENLRKERELDNSSFSVGRLDFTI